MEPELIGGLTVEQIEILGNAFSSGFWTVSLFAVLGLVLGAMFDLIKK